MTSGADFVASIDDWISGEEARQDRIVRGIAEAALARVKELTPVRTGFLRANWSVVPDGQQLPLVVGSSAAGRDGAAPTPVQVDLSYVKAGSVVRIVNPVSYARSIEFGWTTHAKDGGDGRRVEGRHMALQTVLELPGIAARVIADLGDG
jgi:hypothetical protein